LLVDVWNALHDSTDEGLATDNLFNSNFGSSTTFLDPRRTMMGAPLSVGR